MQLIQRAGDGLHAHARPGAGARLPVLSWTRPIELLGGLSYFLQGGAGPPILRSGLVSRWGKILTPMGGCGLLMLFSKLSRGGGRVQGIPAPVCLCHAYAQDCRPKPG